MKMYGETGIRACSYDHAAPMVAKDKITGKEACATEATRRQPREDRICATLLSNPPVLKFLKTRIWEGSVYA